MTLRTHTVAVHHGRMYAQERGMRAMRTGQRVYRVIHADPDTHAAAKDFFRSRERTLKDVVDELLWQEMTRVENEERAERAREDNARTVSPKPTGAPWEKPPFWKARR